jgi:hypothetical protein
MYDVISRSLCPLSWNSTSRRPTPRRGCSSHPSGSCGATSGGSLSLSLSFCVRVLSLSFGVRVLSLSLSTSALFSLSSPSDVFFHPPAKTALHTIYNILIHTINNIITYQTQYLNTVRPSCRISIPDTILSMRIIHIIHIIRIIHIRHTSYLIISHNICFICVVHAL